MHDNDNIRQVKFAGREYKVIFAHLYAENYFDIWLMDAETEKFTDICTELTAGASLKPGQVLVRDEFIEALTQAGVVQSTGETFYTACREGKLHKCDVPVGERTSLRDQDRSLPKAVEQDRSSIQIEREAPERDLGYEIEP